MVKRWTNYLFSGAAIALITPALLNGTIVLAQEQAINQDTSQDIVVTGTSIRGTAPVGANLISVGTDDLAATGGQTISDALRSIPVLSNAGSTGQGPTGAFYQPSIHNLGASASNSTLVLIDGHRGPTGGTNHSFLDPNIIPPLLLQRVEVLPEGASSIYGSDAVAGVVNFITRRSFDGIRADGHYTFTDGSRSYSAGLMVGKSWDSGAAVFAFGYNNLGALRYRDRPFTYPDHRAQGGTSYLNFSCSPATIQPGGAGPIFLDPTSGVSVVNSANNARCSTYDYADLIGSELRHSVMGKITEDVTDRLTLGLDMLYARRRNDTLQSAGTIQATVFQNGPQANPFYMVPAGYTGSAASQVIRWDSTDLVGPAHGYTGSDTMYASFTASYKLGRDWNFDFLGSAGRDESTSFTEGVINQSVANLALNGTTNGGGNMGAISIPGTDVTVLNLPLTTATALDVWNAAATNRTSAAVRAMLLDNNNLLRNTSGYQQIRGNVGGTVFDIPGGPVKIAAGAELYRTQLSQFVARANNSGPASSGSQQLLFKFNREVYSLFGEVDVPVISSDMNVPLVQKFNVNLSGRYDHYSDFGSTSNPKIAAEWQVDDSLRLRGNYSTSFVAPGIDILGDQYGAFGTAGFNAVTNNLEIPVAAYPQLASMGIPGCTAQSNTCNISSLQGIQVTSGDHHAGAQKGSGWSLGLDFTPTFLPAFRASATFFDTKFTGGITGPNIQNVVNTASANYLLTFYPGGATPDEIAQFTTGIPQRTTMPAVTSYIFRSLNSNYLNLHIQGIDYDINYRYQTDDLGTFRVGLAGTQFVKYTQSFGSGPTYSIYNTTGNNGQFPSIATQMRGNLGWDKEGFSSDIYLNYTAGYRNYSGNSVVPITRDANGNPSGGGDPVSSNLTVDLHLSYRLPDLGFLTGTQLSLTARNLFDKDPPFYNGSTGYDSFTGNPFGRMVTFGLQFDLF